MSHADRLLEGLDPEQREVATSLDGPLRVLAGAGTGKTRAITHRIAYGVASGVMVPTEVLAVSFTTRAAGELKSRLASLGAPGVQARTFHSAALRQARYFWPQVFGGELPQIQASKIPLINAAVRNQRLTADPAGLKDVASEIEWAKVSNVTPELYPARAEQAGRAIDIGDPATVGRLYADYEEVKRSRGRMDLEDTLLFAAAVIDADERVASAVRRQYRWFVVDEFQDVSPLQFRLLQLWLGGRDEVCVVGDPAQTIYTFAGASDRYLREFPRTFPGTTSVTLMRNYRSTPEVISVANTVMARRGSDAAVQLRAQRDSGAEVVVRSFPDEQAEAAAIGEAVAAAIAAGTEPRDIAVLARLNLHCDAVAEVLGEKVIPYTRRSATAAERAEGKRVMSHLSAALKGGVEPGLDLVGSVREALVPLGWRADPPQGSEARARWDIHQSYLYAAEAFAAQHPEAGLAEFVEHRKAAAEAEEPVGSGVALTTLHAAKGLEWPVVFVIGAHEGNLPFVYRDTPSDVEEERRLFYVGVTRARDTLQISWSAARSPGSRSSRRPSRFLDGLAGVEAAPAPVVSRRTRKAKGGSRALQECRVCSRPLTDARERKLGRCADCPSSYDETLYAVLKEWRRTQAAEESLPAYCVFTDATMVALAEVKPGDAAALARVPGIGPAKIDKYGAAILGLCTGDPTASAQGTLAG